ncbi:MAG: putative selenate reductase subunit YgfK [Eubacteriales bacterium]|nr:putative selenate reductase subunit YgfK [Eubacteriales bacterium]
MSDRMTPMPFAQMVQWVLAEQKRTGAVFGVYRPYKAKAANNRSIFGRNLETPIGPAAGPHTQLTQNLAAAYYGGSRFFELKTVQILDGEDLPVSKPCIKADDECYNCEWSTELYVPQAQAEYIKGWFLLKMMAKEFGLGDPDGFQFNMSVGYDLEGIKSEKVNTFIDSMMDASNTKEFKECKQYLLDNLNLFEHVTREDVEAISPQICNSATLSTLHGCPPQEIERIATYLIKEKGLNTFIKCNPTLLGYEFARKTMDEMGYDYVAFGDFHFKDDLQYEDAIPMFKRLMALCDEKGLEFGVKITNTFPVDVKQNELPSEEMYMSGKSLYPLSISLAARLTEEFDGKLRISYSGGADAFNIKKIVAAGIWPVTVATTLLKPGGYQRLEQLSFETEAAGVTFTGVDPKAVRALATEAITDRHHVKAVKPLPSRKMKKQVPLVDCFVAPCEEGCPIHQDIPAYLKLVGEGKYEEALRVITEKNPLPFITGTICAHNCMGKCTRNFYESPVHIRQSKLVAAEGGFDAVIGALPAAAADTGKTAAIVGGGPAGMAAAFFLSRAGVKVTLFEAKDSLGGVVKHVIPGFRIADETIAKDARLVTAYGAEVKLNTRVESIDELKKHYDAVILAAGASEPGVLKLESGETVNALEFLADFKKNDGRLNIGKNVVVIGGGNTAMDTARAAKRTEGVEHVYLVYRRTKRYMPADAEELEMAVEDGVEFKELLAPKSLADGKLLCDVMRLGEIDASGRRGVEATGEQVTVDADTVIAAVGERVPTGFYEKNGLNVSERGKVLVNQDTLESSVKGVYVVGDGLNGPATVVEGIRDAKKAAEAIVGQGIGADTELKAEAEDIYARRGGLLEQLEGRVETGRCLSCSAVCENCAEACPNRANVAIRVPGAAKHQIIHVDYMCNECGNCKSFCPYDSAPYLDKFTLFANEADMENSKNQGFTVLDREALSFKVRYLGNILTWKAGEKTEIPEMLCKVMETVCKDYSYLV